MGKKLALIHLTDHQRLLLKQRELEILIEVDKICKKHNITYWLGYGTLLGCVRHGGFIPWDDDIDICMPRNDYVKFRKVCDSELDKHFFYQSHLTENTYYHLFDKIRIEDTVFKESYLANSDINHGIYIDIFPFDYIADNALFAVIQFCEYRFVRAIINSRFINIDARSGIKRFTAIILKKLFCFFSMDKLWRQAEKISSKYSQSPQKRMGCFMSPYGKRDFYSVNLLESFKNGEFEGYSFSIPQKYNEILSSLYGDYMVLPPSDEQKTRHDLVDFDIHLA